MPKSTPCKFDVAWVGPCGNPSDNGWCSKHEVAKCASCGAKAVKSCDYTCGPMSCGAYLCATCNHSLTDDGHVTQEALKQQQETRRLERETVEASRTSPVQRIDSQTGVPVNLFELLKGDWKAAGFRLDKCYSLQLDHGLMAYLPAVVKEDDEVIVTADRQLLIEIWKLLPPRKSKMEVFTAYLHEDKGVCYPDRNEQCEQEIMKPVRIIDRTRFQELMKRGRPFSWAPGLLSFSSDPSQEEFERMINRLVGQPA